MIDFSQLASMIVEANHLADEDSSHFAETHPGHLPTRMNRAHTMRSHLGAIVDVSQSEFSMLPAYRGSGRVFIQSSNSGARFLLQSPSALEFRWELPDESPYVDVDEDTFFLLIYEFNNGQLTLETQAARINNDGDMRQFELLSDRELIGRYPLDGADEAGFDQGDEGTEWFDFGDEPDVGDSE